MDAQPYLGVEQRWIYSIGYDAPIIAFHATAVSRAPPSIANITNRLLQEALIVELGRLRGRRGQSAKRLAINPNGCFSIGLNIDRDHVTMVAMDVTGTVRARVADEVDFALPNAVVAFARKAMADMHRRAFAASGRVLVRAVRVAGSKEPLTAVSCLVNPKAVFIG